MRKNRTTELPPQFPLKLTGTQYRRTRQYLECAGFCLENEFPNNIALLNTKEIIYCVDFRDGENGSFLISALKFKDRKSMFMNPHDSSELGLNEVKLLDLTKYVYSSNSLVSKCFVFAHSNNIEPSKFDPLPENLKELLYISNFEEFNKAAQTHSISELGILSSSSNKWDVLSLHIPGRFTMN